MKVCDSVLLGMSAKTITYLPASGGSRQIDAIIEYLGPQQMNGLTGGSRPQFELLVKNDAIEGINSRELNTGGDKAQIPMRIGRAVKTVRIVELIRQDKAMLRLRAW